MHTTKSLFILCFLIFWIRPPSNRTKIHVDNIHYPMLIDHLRHFFKGLDKVSNTCLLSNYWPVGCFFFYAALLGLLDLFNIFTSLLFHVLMKSHCIEMFAPFSFDGLFSAESPSIFCLHKRIRR